MSMDYSAYEFLKVEVAERVATLTINRPDRLNAVNGPLHHELEQVWIDLAADGDVNAIIFTGAGRAFCAGGDIKGMAEGGFVDSAKKGKGRGRGPITAANGRRLVENMLERRAADHWRDQRRRDRARRHTGAALRYHRRFRKGALCRYPRQGRRGRGRRWRGYLAAAGRTPSREGVPDAR